MDDSSTIDDVQHLIVMCKDGGVTRCRWRDIELEWGVKEEESEAKEPAGFTRPAPTVSGIIGAEPEAATPYHRLFGDRMPKFTPVSEG